MHLHIRSNTPYCRTATSVFHSNFMLNCAAMIRARLASQHIQRCLLILTLGVAGCASTSSLPTEDRVADFAAMKSKAASAQLAINRIPIDATRGKPLELAVHENTNARHDRLFVFIHGVFSDSRMWRYLCWDLANEYDVMAVDLLGCGESDRPDPS